MPAPADLDDNLNEFWIGNPWDVAKKHNLSGYERNRTYLNVGGKNFLDISYVTGTDTDGDGRAAIPIDFNHDGRQDLIVRQVGGGPLKVFENRFPQKHWLRVSLRGVESNRLGIGARLVARVDGRQIVRELFPINTYNSQAPALVHFGLGDAKQVDSLTIKWPSGKKQQLPTLTADRHVLIREGDNEVQTITPGQPLKLAGSTR